MKQIYLKFSMLLLCLVMGLNSAIADEVEVSSFSAVSGDMDNYVSYTAAKGNASTAPAVNNNEIRVYQNGGTFTVSAKNNATITAIELGSSMATTVTYAVDGGSASDSQAITAGGKLSLSGLSATDNVLFTCTGTSKTARLYVNYLKVTYTASTSAASKPSLTTAATFTTSTYDVTITNNESGATVYYTTDGSDPTTSSSSFTGDSKTITIDATTTVKAMAVVNGKDNSSVASATYTYEKSIANTAETAYTTAEAIALIDAGSTQLTTTEVYVKGTISKVDSYNSTYGSLTYWLDNDAFEVYSGLNIDGEKFTGATDLQAGDEVVIKGIIKKYNTTYEFDKNNVLISRQTTATQETPTFTLGTYKTAMTVGDTDDEYTVTTNSDGEVTVTSSDENVAEAIYESGTVLVSAKKAGTATITVSVAATNTYYAASKTYTLTVSAPVEPAELPFSFDGLVADIATTQGMSQTGIGKDYSTTPFLKFDTTGDELIINFAGTSETPMYLSYTIKGNSFSGGTFDVLESADGTNYTSVKSHTVLATTAAIEAYALTSTSNYVKFVYTNKSSGNVALGGINIANGSVRSIAKDGYGTLCLPYAASAEGATVYTVDDIDDNGELTINTVEASELLEAGKPYVYQATANVQTFTYSGEAVTCPIPDNYLTGVFADAEINSGYVLQCQNEVYGFYKVSGTKTVPAYRAYYNGPEPTSSDVKVLGFTTENATAINAINALTSGSAKIYDINGRQINKLQKGINIVNGTKVLVK